MPFNPLSGVYASATASQAAETLFCPKCGTLLDLPSETTGDSNCPRCGFVQRFEESQKLVVVTRNTPVIETTEEEGEKGKDPSRAEIDEECPKCHNPRLLFYTRQLRSADEGQTVFYECPKCAHKFNVNS